MYNEGNVWVGVNDAGEKITLLPKMANRHGLVAGATGTGKTVTLKELSGIYMARRVLHFAPQSLRSDHSFLHD